jgi:homoserine dehydrogenase
MAQISRIFGERGISLSAILQHEAAAGQLVPVVVTTHEATRGDLDQAIAAIEALDVVEGTPAAIRIVDFPEG